MKNKVFIHFTRFTFIWLLMFASCQRQDTLAPIDLSIKQEDIGIAEARQWFSQQQQLFNQPTAKKKISKNPSWADAVQMKFGKINAVVVPLEDDKTTDIPRNRYKDDSIKNKAKETLSTKEDKLNLTLLTNLLVYKKDGETVAELVTLLPDDDFYGNPFKRGSKFNGIILSTDLNDNPLHEYQYKNGKSINTVSLKEPESPDGRPAKYQIIGWIDYYYKVDGGQGGAMARFNTATLTQFMDSLMIILLITVEII